MVPNMTEIIEDGSPMSPFATGTAYGIRQTNVIGISTTSYPFFGENRKYRKNINRNIKSAVTATSIESA